MLGVGTVYDQAGCGCNLTVSEGEWVCQPPAEHPGSQCGAASGPCYPAALLTLPSQVPWVLRWEVSTALSQGRGLRLRDRRRSVHSSTSGSSPNTCPEAHSELSPFSPWLSPLWAIKVTKVCLLP